MTIEVPDELAPQLEAKREQLADIFKRGLCRNISYAHGLWQEVAAFLARGPQPAEITAFHPSAGAIERSRALLQKNKEGTLTAEEEIELDEIEHIDHLVTCIKAEAWRVLRASA